MTKSYHSSSFICRLSSVADTFSLKSIFAIAVTAVLLLNSCEEAPTTLGSEMLPSNDFITISSTDTVSVWSYTMYNSTIPTNDPTMAFIGNILDPYFGTTRSEFVTQVRLGSRWDYGPVTIDSVRLFLQLLISRGGTTGSGNILKISEITNQLYTDSTYYSDSEPGTSGYSVSTHLPAIKADTVNNISVPIPVEFAEYILRDTSMLFYSNTKPDFRSYFKGLYFQVTSGDDPLITTFSPVTTISTDGIYHNYFMVYMHDTSYVSQKYVFILDPTHKNACYNKFVHDFSTADPDKRIPHINDMSSRDTLTYLQYLNGVYTKIYFPSLDSLKTRLSSVKFSINKARLIVPVYYDGDRFTYETVPSTLRLRYEDKDGVKNDVPDYNVDATHKFFNGSLNRIDSSYYFNIPSYIQSYLEDRTGEYKPELEIFQGNTGFNSVVLRANNNSLPVRLEISYIRY